MRKTSIAILLAATLAASTATAREQIRAVGSSTVYPFVTVAAEEFGRNTSFKTPIIEATGTGGGMKLFCAGIGGEFPDISNASRAIKDSEVELCKQNGVTDLAEVKIGYDGIVIANSTDSQQFNLSRKQLFMALAKQVPSNGKLIDNPYQKWSEVDSSLPDTKISVYGPPPTSGTRDAFVELVMEESCVDLAEFKAAYKDKKDRKKSCHLIREDGAFIEAGENDNLIISKLKSGHDSLGIFGYSFLDQNSSVVQGSVIEGVEPDFDNISSGKYKISRPLYVYFKKQHFDKITGLREFAHEIISDNAIGEEGYLTYKGLIPLPADELKKTKNQVK